jgi:hypothetical protein
MARMIVVVGGQGLGPEGREKFCGGEVELAEVVDEVVELADRPPRSEELGRVGGEGGAQGVGGACRSRSRLSTNCGIQNTSSAPGG